MFVPGGYLLAVLADPGRDRVPAVAALVVWFVFELGFYAGRYMVNDIFDRSADTAHPAAIRRGRIPPTVSDTAAWTAVLARAVVCLAAALLLRGRAGVALAAAVGGGVLLSVGYEWLRNQTGRSGPMSTSTTRIRALWVWVGGGYGIRLALGVALAGAPATTVLVAIGAGWIFGVMFVLQTWTLEAAGLFAYGDTATAATKQHIVELVAEREQHIAELMAARVSWHPLRSGVAARRAARWAVVACGAGGLLGLVLAPTAGAPAGMVAEIAAVISATTGLGAFLVSADRPWTTVAVTCMAVAALVAIVPGSGPVAAVVPVIVLVTALVFALSGPELIGIPLPDSDRN